MDEGAQRGPARVRTGPLRRFRRAAGDHRRREPPAGPHRAPRQALLPRGRGAAPVHRADARPAARPRRPVDRARRDDGPGQVVRAVEGGRAAAAARRRSGGAARCPGAAADRVGLAGGLAPGAPVRAHRRRAAPVPLLDGRHVTEPPLLADGPAGLDDGRQPARPRRAGPGTGQRPQRAPPAGQEHDADGRPAAGVVERRSTRERPPGRGVRLPRHGPRHDPTPGRGRPGAGQRRRAAVRAPGGPLPRRRGGAGRRPR